MAKKIRKVRPLESRDMKQSMVLIGKQCASYYAEGLNDDQKRAIVQNIWRYANFAVIAENRRRLARRKKRKKKAKTPDQRLRPANVQTGFKCE